MLRPVLIKAKTANGEDEARESRGSGEVGNTLWRRDTASKCAGNEDGREDRVNHRQPGQAGLGRAGFLIAAHRV